MESKIAQKSFVPQNERRRPNYDDDSKILNSKYTTPRGNFDQQLSHHTIKSKTICEKRDLNNLSLLQEEPTKPGYNINGNKISLFSTWSEEDITSPRKENVHIRPCNFYAKDLIHNKNDRQLHNEVTSNPLTSTMEDGTPCRGKLFSFLCKTNISAIICWISCLFCVLYTMHLRLQIEVRIIRLTNCNKKALLVALPSLRQTYKIMTNKL